MAEAEVGDDVFGDDPDGQRARGARRRAARQGSGSVRLAAARRATSSPSWPTCQRGHETIAGDRAPTSSCDEAGGHAVVVGATDPRRSSEQPDGTLDLGRRSPTPSATRRPPRADHRPRRPREHARPRRRPAAAGRLHAHDRARSPTSAACRSTSTARGSSTPSSRSASRPRELAAPADTRDVLPVEGPRRPRSAPWSSARRPFISRARRARKLLGGGMRQVGVLAAAGLVALRDGDGGHDRAPRRGPRERPPAGRGARRPRRHRSPGGIAQPRSATASIPRASRPTSCCSAWSAIARRSSTRSRRAACCMVALRARPGPRRDALRRSTAADIDRTSPRSTTPCARPRPSPAGEPATERRRPGAAARAARPRRRCRRPTAGARQRAVAGGT